MSETKRDPRVGEVWRKGQRSRTVIGLPELRGLWVAFQTPSDMKTGTVQQLRLEYWREWTAGAEVIHAGE